MTGNDFFHSIKKQTNEPFSSGWLHTECTGLSRVEREIERERERERDGQILRGGGLHGRALWIVTTIDNNTRVESARVCRPSTKRRNCGMMTGAGAPC